MSLRAAQVRFYVDADVLGLGKILGGLRSDITHPGDPGTVIHKRHRALTCRYEGGRRLLGSCLHLEGSHIDFERRRP
jgi:hypothetical protein